MPTTAVNFSTCLLSIGVDLAGLLRGRGAWRAPKVGRCRVGWSMGRGVPSPADLGVWGSVVSSPSGVRGKAPAENGFLRISKATECSFLYLYDKIWGGTICISVPPLQILGGLVPPVPPPWSTPMLFSCCTVTTMIFSGSYLAPKHAITSINKHRTFPIDASAVTKQNFVPRMLFLFMYWLFCTRLWNVCSFGEINLIVNH